MSNRASILSTLIALVISWLLPAWAIINNRLAPSYESALGVAYAMAIGLAVHIVVVIVWCIIHRRNIRIAQLVVLFISILLMLILITSDIIQHGVAVA